MAGIQGSVTKMVIFKCICMDQAQKNSLERSNPLAKDILSLMILNRKYSNLMKKIKKLFGMVIVLEINGYKVGFVALY